MWSQGRELDWTWSPLEVLARWPRDRRVMMLHSGRAHSRWSRHTILAEPGDALTCHDTATGVGRSTWHGQVPCPAPLTHHPLRDLRAVIRACPGLWIGMLSYDLRLWTEPVLRAGAVAQDDRGWPVLAFARCPGWLVYDHVDARWRAGGAWSGDPPNVLQWSPHVVQVTPRITVSVPAWSPHRYRDAAQRVGEYIAAGDVFQVNLAQRFTASVSGEYPAASRTIYDRLAAASPAWYGAYLELPPDPDGRRRVLLSTSPELFLDVTTAGRIITRPIKGTRPASAPPHELRDSDKDIAELNMIVDLMRNDLGRVCAYGSVQVEESRVIEHHPTVQHGVATVTGQLHHTRDLFDLLRATLPGGSITGAPKVRAMQLIDELEVARRGPYCGAIGWIAGGACGFNIAIRTMLHDIDAGRIDVWAGGGIVADSDPSHEYDETLHKAAAMFAALSPHR